MGNLIQEISGGGGEKEMNNFMLMEKNFHLRMELVLKIMSVTHGQQSLPLHYLTMALQVSPTQLLTVMGTQ